MRKEEEEKRVKEEKMMVMKKRKEGIKEFIGVCEEVVPGSKYDKFFCEEFVKKLKKNEEIDELITKIR